MENYVRAVEPGVPILIAGDFNARSAAWGDWCQDLRGNELSSLFDSLELVVMNEGSKPTFVGRGRGSIVDITAVSEHIVRRIQDWRVCDEAESASDHQYIEFKVRDERNLEGTTQNKPRGWRTEAGINVQDMEVGLLLARWIDDPVMYSEAANANRRARAVEEMITVACDFALERRAPTRPGKPPVHWWNPEIATQRGVCIAARRRKTRCSARLHRLRNRIRTQGLVVNTTGEEESLEAASRAYKEARMNLRMAITRSKALSWKQLIQSVDGDVRGKPYKLVTRKLQGPPATSIMETESVKRITDVLFPSRVPLDAQNFPAGEKFPPFTIEEVNMAVHRAQRKATAPGLDNITGRILSAVHLLRPSMLIGLYNQCVRDGVVPVRWKRARVVLLRKAGKPEGEPSSYRPICLLNVIGKVFETVLVARLEEHITSRGGLSPNQHGFRKAISTDDAVLKLQHNILAAINFPSEKFCVAVSLDIRNAFNSIGWTEVMSALNILEVPNYLRQIFNSYFQGRTAETQAGNNNVEVQVTCGVPQGSVVGPLLWNVAYDSVLRLQLPAGTELLGFADDTMVIVSGATIMELEQKTNETLNRVSGEIIRLGLSLAVNKTEAVLFTNKYKHGNPALLLDGQALELKQQMKYLGMVVDRKLLFKEHTSEAAARAERTANVLARLMPNIGGPKQLRRKLYVAVTQSVLLYGSPSWAHTLEFVPGNVAHINRVQRKALLRSICAYRTVSGTATNILAGVPPADLLARERSMVFQGRRSGRIPDTAPRAKTVTTWIARVAESQTGSWTKHLIRDIKSWCNRNHGCLDYHTTQLLSGHGCFGHYLCKIGKEPSAKCHHCPAENDTAEHTLFDCPAWEEDRWEMNSVNESMLDSGNIISSMLSSPRRWEAVKKFAGKVMTAKAAAEREREKRGRNQRGRGAD